MSPQVAPAVTGTGETAGPLLRVENLRVHFQPRRGLLGLRQTRLLRAVDGVSFDVPQGRTLGLVGESGCGKTTTAKAILRLVPIQSGRIELDGVDLARTEGSRLRQIRRRMQMIFQDPFASLNPRLTVAGILLEPLDIHAAGSRRERRARVNELLELVGLSPRVADRYPHEFSGGQRQRIGVARALALHPDLIVADEPVSALDVSIQAQITNLLQELQERLGLTYLYIAHDLPVVRHISHQVAVMYLGKIVETADTTDVFERPTHPYTIALLSAVPIPDPELETRRRRIILTGDVPSAFDPPSGCHFHTRCWLRQRLGDPEICVTTDPALAGLPRLAPGHRVACHFVEESLSSEERASVTAATGSAADAHGTSPGPAATVAPDGRPSRPVLV